MFFLAKVATTHFFDLQSTLKVNQQVAVQDYQAKAPATKLDAKHHFDLVQGLFQLQSFRIALAFQLA